MMKSSDGTVKLRSALVDMGYGVSYRARRCEYEYVLYTMYVLYCMYVLRTVAYFTYLRSTVQTHNNHAKVNSARLGNHPTELFINCRVYYEVVHDLFRCINGYQPWVPMPIGSSSAKMPRPPVRTSCFELPRSSSRGASSPSLIHKIPQWGRCSPRRLVFHGFTPFLYFY
jgi:hypothetical protein